MELNVSQVKENNQYYVKIERSQDFDDFVWQELLKTIKQFQKILNKYHPLLKSI